jgi:hypothetical protein
MAHLYELSTIFAHVLAEIEDGDPEAAGTALAKIDALEGAFNDKAVQVAFVIRNMEAFGFSVQEEADRMAAKAKAVKDRVCVVKEYLRSNMERASVTKIECPQFKISLRNNPPKVNIINEKAIPVEYIKTPEPPLPYPDKKKIIDDWKQGVVIDGVEIAMGNRVEIK